MNPIVQVLIDRIEALAIERAGLSAKIDGMRQDFQSAERVADERGEQIKRLKAEAQLLRDRNCKLNGALIAIGVHAESDTRTLSSLIHVVRHETGWLELDKRAEEL